MIRQKNFLNELFIFSPQGITGYQGLWGSILLFESLVFGKGPGGRHQNLEGEGKVHTSDKPLFPEITNAIPHTQLTLFTHSFVHSNNMNVH